MCIRDSTTIYVTHDQVEAMTMADRIVLMRDGIIQQVSTPKDIYLYPNNIFVAGFMGSPAMNFIPVKVTENGLETETSLLKISDVMLNSLTLRDYMGKEIIFGIRPENLYLSKDVGENDRYVKFDTKVRLAEMLGSETLIHFLVDNINVIAKINTLDDFTRNQDISLAYDLDFVNLFDRQTTERIILDSKKDYKQFIRKEERDSGKCKSDYEKSYRSSSSNISVEHSKQAKLS